MKCSVVQELIPEFINGAVDKSQEKLIFQHLSSCSECVGELAFWISVADCNKVEKIEPTKKKQLKHQVVNEKCSPLDLVRKAVKVYFKVVKQVL